MRIAKAVWGGTNKQKHTHMTKGDNYCVEYADAALMLIGNPESFLCT